MVKTSIIVLQFIVILSLLILIVFRSYDSFHDCTEPASSESEITPVPERANPSSHVQDHRTPEQAMKNGVCKLENDTQQNEHAVIVETADVSKNDDDHEDTQIIKFGIPYATYIKYKKIVQRWGGHNQFVDAQIKSRMKRLKKILTISQYGQVASSYDCIYRMELYETWMLIVNFIRDYGMLNNEGRMEEERKRNADLGKKEEERRGLYHQMKRSLGKINWQTWIDTKDARDDLLRSLQGGEKQSFEMHMELSNMHDEFMCMKMGDIYHALAKSPK